MYVLALYIHRIRTIYFYSSTATCIRRPACADRSYVTNPSYASARAARFGIGPDDDDDGDEAAAWPMIRLLLDETAAAACRCRGEDRRTSPGQTAIEEEASVAACCRKHPRVSCTAAAPRRAARWSPSAARIRWTAPVK